MEIKTTILLMRCGIKHKIDSAQALAFYKRYARTHGLVLHHKNNKFYFGR
jgi:hypothetical protein